jgi:hypothetical protein
MRRYSLLVAERSDLSHAIVGSTAVVTASMRLPLALLASALPYMATPDHDGQKEPSLNTNHVAGTCLSTY